METSKRESDSQCAPDHSENQTLGEQLADNPRPARPQSSSHCHLLLSCPCFGKQKIRDIGAGDQEKQPHSAEYDPESFTDAAGKSLLEGEQPDSPLFGKLCGLLFP